MVKRFFVWVCVLVVSFFCVFVSLIPCGVSAESGGGGSYRGYYTGTSGYDADDVDTSVSSDDLYNFVNDAMGSSSSYDITTWDITKDFFAYGSSLIGAIFSSEFTFSSVYTSWSNYMYDAYFSSGDMHEFISWAFYYGKDGSLHFTDDFVNSIYQYINPEMYSQGLVQIPCNCSQNVLSYYTGLGNMNAYNFITSVYSSSGFTIVPVYSCIWQTGSYIVNAPYANLNCPAFFTSSCTSETLLSLTNDTLGFVVPFSSYSAYQTLLSRSSPSYSEISTFSFTPYYMDSGSLCSLILSANYFDGYYTICDNSGSSILVYSTAKTDSSALLSSSTLKCYSGISNMSTSIHMNRLNGGSVPSDFFYLVLVLLMYIRLLIGMPIIMMVRLLLVQSGQVKVIFMAR